MTITKHAIERFIARSGDTEKVVERLQDMIRRSKPATASHRYPGRESRVFGEWLLVMHGDTLVTVFTRHKRTRIRAKR